MQTLLAVKEEPSTPKIIGSDISLEVHVRELHLKVAKLDCKLSARHVLGTCGSGPALRAIQHWHV
ncbi:hypothetical protein GSI_08788 [Ganoderma sinense ZZ0214-1]|uniref:Uncharacterized protein n=1 Tax=Ganoderma sinense ZZ0214-1 TaxID=1077348 RepID=A0A2G8S4T8_9APHY|nr:hypothetical protein GSI_08788 [Ganoderma sinense ZZ0214-1]